MSRQVNLASHMNSDLSLDDVKNVKDLTSNISQEEPSLENAFDLFSDISGQIEKTQKNLEKKLNYLNSRMLQADQERAEEILQKQALEQAFCQLIEMLPAGVICLDKNGEVKDANKTAENLLETTLKGRVWREVIGECFAPRPDDGHEISLKNGRRVNVQTQPVKLSHVKLHNAEKIGTEQVVLIQDLTETREFQNKIAREKRLSELGKMTATLAHQIRTPLSTALLYANHLCDYELSEEKQRRSSRKLRMQLTHIEQQIQDMLFYVRGDIPLRDGVTIKELMFHSLQATKAKFDSKNIALETTFNVQNQTLNCHRDALVGSICNLLCNAIDASPVDGKIYLETHFINPDDRDEKQNKKLEIVIRDEGSGISQQEIKQLFSPFFTTKKNGNGLGLVTAKNVIESHGGQLIIEPDKKSGTRVQILLPTNSVNIKSVGSLVDSNSIDSNSIDSKVNEGVKS